MDSVVATIRELTSVQSPRLVPELRVRVAEELVPTWQRLEADAGRTLPPPYWAFVWPGSHALARLLLDCPALVADKRVLDVGAGGGLASIAAMRAGAASAVAADIDDFAPVAQRLNAELNDVLVTPRLADPIDRPVADVEVVVVGDLWYERALAARLTRWLRGLVDRGVDVLVADPGRTYSPRSGLLRLAGYRVPTTRELEREDEVLTHVARLAGMGDTD
ncbi:MAG: methyltransferase [Chloroflexi bacterium]|nr:methyltransferase [Chloroflexota bacterium]